MDLNDFTFSEDIEVLHQLDANGNALLLERPESGDEMSEVDGSRELNVNLSSILTSTRSEEELGAFFVFLLRRSIFSAGRPTTRAESSSGSSVFVVARLAVEWNSYHVY